jgi:hypothetical protein
MVLSINALGRHDRIDGSVRPSHIYGAHKSLDHHSVSREVFAAQVGLEAGGIKPMEDRRTPAWGHQGLLVPDLCLQGVWLDAQELG